MIRLLDHRFYTKLTPGEEARLRRLHAQSEGKVRKALDAFLKVVKSDRVLRKVIEYLQSSNVEEIMKLIDSYIVVMANSVTDIFRDAAESEMSTLADKVDDIFPEGAAVGIAFDATYPRAAELMRRNRLQFITEYTRKQRNTTRQVLIDALRSGLGPEGAARQFREVAGLTTSQWNAVKNYRRLLEELRSEALSRDLRDRRFDRTIRRAIDNGRPLTQDQIDRMVERYTRRALDYRSEMIARTETTRVLSQARDEAIRQAHEQANIPDSWVRRTWRTNMDGRERDTHGAMNGQVVTGMDSYFSSPSGARLKYPGDPAAPAHEVIHCRCTVEISYVPT